MAELTITTVVSSIKEIADPIERLRNPGDIDLLKLRLDYISRMLVTLDIPEEIVNSQCTSN
jgi:3-dehydroquinate dehydratase